MSALVPEVGDRYEIAGRLVQVVAIERGYKAAGPKSEHRARLRGVDNGGQPKLSMERPIALDKLAFDTRFRFLGNYLPPDGYTLHRVGAHWYVRDRPGNVSGAGPGVRWTEEDALKYARALAAFAARIADSRPAPGV